MNTMAVDTVTLDLRHKCDFAYCQTFAEGLHTQLNTDHYRTNVSLMPVYNTRQDWEAEHRTARKAAWRAERIGYVFSEVDNSQYSDDIFVINTSKQERQGRPMSDGYQTNVRRGRLSFEQTRCYDHRTHTYGVTSTFGTLVAYLTLHRCGDLAMVSMILGHGDHEPNGIMSLLIAGTVEDQAGAGGWFYYNRHDSGTEGLRFKKERYGFQPGNVEFKL